MLLIITLLTRRCKLFPSGNGLNLSKFNDFPTLLNAAETYYSLGYAVIPLLGDFDPDRPKVAARAWSAYQNRLANLDEFNAWFSPEGGAAALGIVTGRISRLVVLDFDSADLFSEFRRRFPDLLETRTVQSAGRGLPHLYFHLPPYLSMASQKRAGVDLLSDGRYVVAPPTVINDQPYRITRGGMPRSLNDYDIKRLQSFVTGTQSRSQTYIKVEPPPASSPLSRSNRGGLGRESNPPTSTSFVEAGLIPPAVSNVATASSNMQPPLSTQWRGVEGEDASSVGTQHAVSAPVVSPVSTHTLPLPSRAALHGLYLYWCGKGGRNDALFRTALYARDHGLDEAQTRRLLVAIHVSTPSPVNEGGLRRRGSESAALRQREAYATIHSAFSRPARVVTTPSPACGLSANEPAKVADGLGRGFLPNSIREALLQRNLTCVVRTLEGLYQAGFRPGRGFITEPAIEALKGIVGRDSVYHALNALAPNGQPFFPRRSPSALPPASSEAARQKHPLKTKKCFFVTEKKSGIKKRGVKARRFKFPTIESLCKLLEVEITGSDPLTRDDLTSARQTRMALHRELIKRRPDEYTHRWLAKRIGVSRRTISTYNRLIPIHSQPTFHETTLSWANIDSLLSDEVLSGAHIETILGKKYPALHSIACKELAKGTFIRLKERKGNFYWYGSDAPPPHVEEQMQRNTPNPSPSPIVTGEGSRRRLANFQGRDDEGRDYPKGQNANQSVTHAVSNSVQVSASTSSVGKGLRPFRELPTASLSVGTRHAVSASHLPSPSPACGGGLGRGLSSASPAALTPEKAEALAQTIYERVNQYGDGTSKRFSLKNARKFVKTYTEKHIHFALERLSQRKNLASPTGFFVTVLRSTARMNEF